MSWKYYSGMLHMIFLVWLATSCIALFCLVEIVIFYKLFGIRFSGHPEIACDI